MSAPKKLMPDNGVISKDMTTITYTALPYPLPEPWRQEFIEHTLNRPGDVHGLEALEIRCRAAIGVEVIRPNIPPVLRNLPLIGGPAA